MNEITVNGTTYSSELSDNPLEDYQVKTRLTDQSPLINEERSDLREGTVYHVLGLTNEAGEFAGKIKKVFRDKNGKLSKESRTALKDELGDILWYLTQICTDIGVSLETIMSENLEKLFDRYNRNQINGDGDNR